MMKSSIITSLLVSTAYALPSFCPTPIPTAEPVQPVYTCGPDNYVAGNGGGGSCGICTDNCGNDNQLILNFFGLTGDSSDVSSISNDNGAISYCKDINPKFVCCGPKFTPGNGGVFIKNSNWYLDPTHGEPGEQPAVSTADSGVCSYGLEGDASSWLMCSGSDAETCVGGSATVEGAAPPASSTRRLTGSSDVFSDISSMSVIDISEDLSIDASILIACQSLVVNGNGFEVNGNAKTNVFHISHADTTFNDLTITNGSSANGGGVLVDGTSTVTFNRCTISSNVATSHGGGLYFSGDSFLTLNMFDSFVRSNIALKGSGGGIYSSGDTVVFNLVRSSFTKNSCHDDGGGLCVRGNGTKSIDSLACSYKTNTAGRNGGGLFIGDGGTAISSDSSNTVVGNTAGKVGGGLYIGGDGHVVVSHYDITVSHNTASSRYDTSDEIYYEVSSGSAEAELTECRASTESCGSNGFIQASRASSTSCKVSDTYTRGSRTCFSSEDMVMFENGEEKFFKDLNIGDKILSANRDGEMSFSPVVFLPHGENDTPTKFVEIKTGAGKVIRMTRRHLLPLCSGKLMVAQEINPGDCLRTKDGDGVVATVAEVEINGVYTAVTENEFLVVNGIIASPFASPTAIAHALYNATDAAQWCTSNNWLAYESAQHHLDKNTPSEDCEQLLEEMFENYKEEPVGWGVDGWGYKGWKNPSSRDLEPHSSITMLPKTEATVSSDSLPSKRSAIATSRSMLLKDILHIEGW